MKTCVITEVDVVDRERRRSAAVLDSGNDFGVGTQPPRLDLRTVPGTARAAANRRGGANYVAFRKMLLALLQCLPQLLAG